jgi:hypothetical protein
MAPSNEDERVSPKTREEYVGTRALRPNVQILFLMVSFDLDVPGKSWKRRKSPWPFPSFSDPLRLLDI